MTDQKGLERYYSGDSAWNQIAKVASEEWSRCPFAKQLLKELNGDRKLAAMIWYHLQRGSIDWLDTRPPVLDGMSPRECLASKNGLKRLKEALMRFP